MLVNILVMTTISIVTNMLGLRAYMTPYGIDYGQLMIFCLMWGFGGALISLALSRVMAKWMMGVKVIENATLDQNERWLITTVKHLSEKAGLPRTPEVGIYNSEDPNAFATGPTKSRALVAVSTGLLQRMNRSEVEAVLAHEVAHIANGDMVTMTLLQGLMSSFCSSVIRRVSVAFSSAA